MTIQSPEQNTGYEAIEAKFIPTVAGEMLMYNCAALFLFGFDTYDPIPPNGIGAAGHFPYQRNRFVFDFENTLKKNADHESHITYFRQKISNFFNIVSHAAVDLGFINDEDFKHDIVKICEDDCHIIVEGGLVNAFALIAKIVEFSDNVIDPDNSECDDIYAGFCKDKIFNDAQRLNFEKVCDQEQQKIYDRMSILFPNGMTRKDTIDAMVERRAMNRAHHTCLPHPMQDVKALIEQEEQAAKDVRDNPYRPQPQTPHFN